MSTIVASLPTLQRDNSCQLKRKADPLSIIPTDMLAHVKRARTSFDTDIYLTPHHKTFSPTLITPTLTVSLASDTELVYSSGGDGSAVSAYPNGHILGTIAAVASSEFSLFGSAERKSPPPPTQPSFFAHQYSQESVASSPNRSFSEDDTFVDPHFDLDIDPESEDLDEAKEDVWASLLFFIGKPRDTKKGDQSPDSSFESVESVAPKIEAKEIKKAKKLKRRRGHFPKATTDCLKQWLFDHMDHPYPTEDEKAVLAEDTGLTVKQINYWFTNSRRRFLKPKNE